MADIGRSGWRNVGSLMPCPGSLPAIAATHRSASSSSLGAGPQGSPQVGLLAGEQAVADLTVGGEPDPVAVAAERAGHRGDHADGRGAAVDQEQLGRGAPPRLASRGQGEVAAELLEDLVGGDHLLAVPVVLGVERHLLDEAQLVLVVDRPGEQVARLVVVDPAQQDGVDLDRRQPRVVGRLGAARARRRAGRGG